MDINDAASGNSNNEATSGADGIYLEDPNPSRSPCVWEKIKHRSPEEANAPKMWDQPIFEHLRVGKHVCRKHRRGRYGDGYIKHKGNKSLLFEMAQYEVGSQWGTRYPCLEENLESYRRRPSRTRKHPMSKGVAIGKLVKFLHKKIVNGSREHAAIPRLADGLTLVEWGPDLIIKAFDDLDLLFFKGVLATRTRIDWKTDKWMRRQGAPRDAFGFCLNMGYGRCHIVLNATTIFLRTKDSFAHMWCTMLHEMVVGYRTLHAVAVRSNLR
ncbi:MAG: hypothetical protein Q9181_000660 [Wetmoreana brouardii]